MIEHGAYTLLLDEYYATGLPLPAEVNDLYRICRAIGKKEKQIVVKILNLYFYFQEGFYHNKKADEQIAKRCDISEKRSNAAKSRYDINHANAGDLHTVLHPTSTSTTTNTPLTPQGGNRSGREKKWKPKPGEEWKNALL